MVSPFYLFNMDSLIDYEKEILTVLAEAGQQGLSLRKIAKHVHNSCNSLFEESDYEQVCRKVQSYIKRNKSGKNPPVEMYKRGVYRLNLSSPENEQLKLDFYSKEKNSERLDTPQ